MIEFLTASDVLDAAADYIEEHGWVQGQYANLDGAVCVSGAICAILTGDPCGYKTGFKSPFRPSPEKIFLECNQIYTESIGDWNDAPGRTKEDVVSGLRLAGKKSR